MPVSRLYVAALLLPVMLALPFPAVPFIMGDDDRVPLDMLPPSAALRQTGVVRVNGEDLATGLLTGANCDVVLSAGHPLVQAMDPPAKVAGLAFRPGSPGAEALSMILVASGGERASDYDDDARDWAVYRLSGPLPGGCSEVGIDVSDCRAVMMPAFHFDHRDGLLVDRRCHVYPSASEGVLIHDCDGKEGSSGAPLLCRSGDRLVAINVSGLTRRGYADPGTFGQRGERFDPGSHKNYAVALSGRLAAAVRKELAASRGRAGDQAR